MPQLNKTSSGNNPAGKVPTSEKHVRSKSEVIAKTRENRRTVIIIASVVVVLILIIVGVSLYFSENARYKRLTVITVDDTSIKMDYFLKRMRIAGTDSMVMLEALTNEQLIKIEAPKYGIEASPEDVGQELRRIASGESGTISESEFEEWYRQTLNESDFSDSEYRELVATSLLAARLQGYLAARVPTVTEQVYLHIMLLSEEDIGKIRERLDAGEDLGELATEVWLDKQPEGEVEEVGWMPRGIMPSSFDEVAFNLTIGDVSKPLAYASDPEAQEISYYLFMVSERADAREVDEGPLQVLQVKVLDDWLLAEIKLHEVEWYGLHNGFDSETNYWINWQLSR